MLDGLKGLKHFKVTCTGTGPGKNGESLTQFIRAYHVAVIDHAWLFSKAKPNASGDQLCERIDFFSDVFWAMTHAIENGNHNPLHRFHRDFQGRSLGSYVRLRFVFVLGRAPFWILERLR